MNLTSWLLILTGVGLNAAAQLLLKAGTRSVGEFAFSMANVLPIGWKLATEPHILGGLACYVVSVVAWILVLSRVEVSLAYPMVSFGYIVTALASWWLFGEALSIERISGILVIMLGVFLITRT
ncbi:MAG: 4-amino-4-deoxy-L-arabinose transferase [Betaproteobacteria bacterium]|nr:4-amino-4-deoxy-L-arabinose transferase [Betaproteobacteria bacterium]